MRKTILLSAALVLLVAGLGVAVVACGSSTATSSSTTLGTATSVTAAGETTTSATAAGDTTTMAAGDTTSTTAEVTTTTEAAQTTDTVDHAADIKAQYPSTESFDISTWATVNAAPASHLGAAADITGQPSKVTVDPDSKYLTWTLTITGTTGQSMTVLCRTNVTIDRTLLSGGGAVEVKGLVVGSQAADAGSGAIIYVESVQKAA
jgi:uncharacterized cupredoxin-like copper-binding protein